MTKEKDGVGQKPISDEKSPDIGDNSDSVKHKKSNSKEPKPKENALFKVANNNNKAKFKDPKNVAKDGANKAAQTVGKAAATKGAAVAGYASLASLFMGTVNTAATFAVQTLATLIGATINAVIQGAIAIGSALVAIAATSLTGVVGLVVLGALVVAVPVIMWTTDQMTQAARVEDKILACNIENKNARAKSTLGAKDGPEVDISEAAQKENVEKTNSVIKSYKSGVTDAQIAGIVGPWFAESGIQPKRYESDYIFKNKYDLLDKKGPTAEVLSGGWGPFAAKYSISLNESGYLYEGKHYIGIGLGQWTGVRAKLLWDFAKKSDSSMFDMDTQLSYMVGPDPGKSRLDAYLEQSKGMTADQASTLFLEVWEGVPGNKVEMRAKAAVKWHIEIKKMKVDKDYAKSILSAANVKMAEANSKSAKLNLDDGCGGKVGDANVEMALNGTGAFPADVSGYVWTNENLPKSLRKYVIDMRAFGYSWGQSGGFAENSGQCVDLTETLGGLIWLGRPTIVSGDGYKQATAWASRFGGKITKAPTAKGDIFSSDGPTEAGHTGIVSHVFANGDIMITEQNFMGVSGAFGIGKVNTWNYRYVKKTQYKSEGWRFTHPKGKKAVFSKK